MGSFTAKEAKNFSLTKALISLWQKALASFAAVYTLIWPVISYQGGSISLLGIFYHLFLPLLLTGCMLLWVALLPLLYFSPALSLLTTLTDIVLNFCLYFPRSCQYFFYYPHISCNFSIFYLTIALFIGFTLKKPHFLRYDNV